MKITCPFDDTTHKVVPIEPTEEMIAAKQKSAGIEVQCVQSQMRNAHIRKYHAMIAAAPPYPADNTGWISVDDRLPEPYTEVMVFPHPTDYCMIADMSSDKNNRKGWWYYSEYITGFGDFRTLTDKITHWMPLPLPPSPKGE